jgi:hypothetical protein
VVILSSLYLSPFYHSLYSLWLLTLTYTVVYVVFSVIISLFGNLLKTAVLTMNSYVQELANLPTVELFQKDGSPSARKLFILWNPALRPKTVSWSSVVLVKQYNSSSANGKHILTNQMLLLLDCSYPVKLGLLWIMMSWQMKVLILFVQGDNSHMFNDKKFCNYWFNAYSLILTCFLTLT